MKPIKYERIDDTTNGHDLDVVRILTGKELVDEEDRKFAATAGKRAWKQMIDADEL